ncbi:MAG: YcxB family protein [Spirochaetes bacterium]|nr:YcxB family protein [Spirochaetota bacterium]MBN2770726.1 YcxB family protein [Spirochaetota bacterium]
MQIEYEVTKDDIVHFNKYHLMHSKETKAMLSRSRLLHIIYVIIITIALSYSTDNWIMFSVFGFIIIVLYMLRFKKNVIKNIEKNVGKAFDSDDNLVVLGKQILDIQEDGLFSKGQASEGKTFWNGLTKIIENDGYIFIYLGTTKAFVIRKESVTKGEPDLFIAELKKKMEPGI